MNKPRNLEIGAFQDQVASWMAMCFGPEVSADKKERAFRFLEEALELAQASGVSRGEAGLQLTYTYNRPEGKVEDEVGQVLLTLAALCNAHALNLGEQSWQALYSAWARIDTIRAKWKSKPQRNGPLPGAIQTPDEDWLANAKTVAKIFSSPTVEAPEGYASWQDAAIQERVRRVVAERALAAQLAARDIEIDRLRSLLPCTPAHTVCDRCNNDSSKCSRKQG